MAELIINNLITEADGNGDPVDLYVGSGSFCVLDINNKKSGRALFRMISGLEKTVRGDILIGGKSVKGVQASTRNIALVFQKSTLYAHLTVYDNILFAMKRNKADSETDGSKIARAAKTFSFEDFLYEKPLLLSEEQLFKAEMGRLSVLSPDVVLMYDPLCRFRGETLTLMKNEVMKLYKTLGTTFVYFSESPYSSEALACVKSEDEKMIIRSAG